MALEEALLEHKKALDENNELLRQIVGAAKANMKAGDKKAAAADEDDEADEKPAATKRKPGRPAKTAAADDDEAPAKKASSKKAAASDDDDADEKPAAKKGKALKTDDAVEAVKGFINAVEVEVDEDDEPVDTPENQKALKKRNNRKAFVMKCLGNLGVEGTKELTDPADIAKLIKWIEQKSEGVDPFADDET
jgi:hypothetical protein